MGATVAGNELHKIWGIGQYLWAIPAAAVIAALLGFTGRKNMEMGQLAGGLPLVFLAIALYKFGEGLFKGLLFGSYLTLATGVFLLCVAPRLVGKPSQKSATQSQTSAAIPHESQDNRG
jgi:hypothetical protein